MNRGQAATAPAEGTTQSDLQTTRETVESVVVAIVLAFLFRAFVAEAFVIPTGSMAPTLQGRHLDIYCEQCGYRYQTGASSENYSPSHHDYKLVEDSTCPICHYTIELDRSRPGSFFLFRGNRDAFNGDRILVSKFAYQLADPERWDVIVFKYPGNAKQNYIKRLVGLPGETLWIKHGDVFVSSPGDQQDPGSGGRRIARKPPKKVKAMLQMVDDTDHIGQRLRELGWPSRWQQQSEVQEGNQWLTSEDGSQFRVAAGGEESWLRYRHFAPLPTDWEEINRTNKLPERLKLNRGQLIMDYYPYNDSNATYERYADHIAPSQVGTAWVGDLAIESDVIVKSETGHLLLKLVEGGRVFDCRIDVETGAATLTIDGGQVPFVSDDGKTAQVANAKTRLRGAGSYHVRFANVDDKLFLWVNERYIKFDFPTTFGGGASLRPKWSPEDPLDLAPLGIGGQNIELQVTRLKVLRDIYYMALEMAHSRIEYDRFVSTEELLDVMTNPHSWETTRLFETRREVRFELEEDQFFPMGDNSPQSKDARLWSNRGDSPLTYDDPPPYVARRYLIGKALLIYWPHAWRPFWPNFSRMKTIR